MQPSPTSVTLKNRFTWVALILCVISVIVVLGQFGTSAGLGIKALVIGIGLLSALIWFVLFQNSAEYHNEQIDAADAARRREAAQIEAELRELGQEQAAHHVGQLSSKLDDYQNVLKMKFGENEITYHTTAPIAIFNRCWPRPEASSQLTPAALSPRSGILRAAGVAIATKPERSRSVTPCTLTSARRLIVWSNRMNRR